MNFLSNLLSWAELFPGSTNPTDTNYSPYAWMGNVFGTISIVLYVIMGLVGAIGAIYAIWLGVQLARADEQSKRDDAKKHLITCLIAVAVTVVLVLFFNELMPLIVQAFIGKDIDNPSTPGTNTMITMFKMLTLR